MIKRCLVASCCFLFAVAAVAQAGAIHYAAAHGDIAKIQTIIKNNPKLVNDADSDRATPLHWAAASGQIKAAEFLLANKASVTAQKKDGVTPLHVASALNQIDVAKLLLAYRANPNTSDKKGRTPVTLAQGNNNKAMVDLLSTTVIPTPKAIAAHPVAKPSLPKARPVAVKIPAPSPEPGTPQSIAANADNTTLAQSFVSLVAQDDFANATNMFDQTMKDTMSTEKLGQTWRLIKLQAGQFKKQAGTRVEKTQGFDNVFVTCEFEKANLNVKVVFNNSKQISGLWILPVKAPQH